MFTKKEIAIGAAVLLALMVVSLMAMGLSAPRGESTYNGEVVDLENQKGIPATSQAHLKTDAMSSSVETFCVRDDPGQMDTLRNAASNSSDVTVTYQRGLYVPIWECEPGTSVITDIEVK